MKMSEMYPTKYISCSDLQGKVATVQIERVEIHTMDEKTGERKPVAYFAGKTRGLALNKTNGHAISLLYGDDSDGWIGQSIEIFPAQTDFGGKIVDCIRVRGPQGGMVQPAAPPPAAAPAPPSGDLDDEIPF